MAVKFKQLLNVLGYLEQNSKRFDIIRQELLSKSASKCLQTADQLEAKLASR